MRTVLKPGWIVACVAGVSLVGMPACWAAKIAQVDTARVVQEYQRTKDTKIELEKEYMDKRQELKSMSDNLEKEQGDLTTKKGIVSQQEYDSLQAKFDADQKAFQEKYVEFKNSFTKKQQDLMEAILSDVKALVGKIAKAEKYEAVFDKEIMLYGGEDITDKVLTELNKKK